MSDDELVDAIRSLLAPGPFHGEGYRKIWARLRFAGIRTSRRRVLRLAREHGLQAPGRIGRPRGPKAHDGTIRTERVDAMWGSDLTSTVTAEGQVSIFIAVDHCSAECIGIHAARRATRFEALEPIRQGVRTCFGAFAEGIATGLELRQDPCGVVGTPHPTGCSPFVADDDQRELAFLGIASSPAFVREPEGKGCVERFIRTLKENLLWVRRGGAPARDRHLGAAADLAQGSGDPEPAHGARGRDLPHQTSSSAKARALCGGARSTTVIAHAPSSCPTT